ncbi:MAG: aldehyde dehydrogenase (NADP(+)) [Dehalococcoidia bacterium]
MKLTGALLIAGADVVPGLGTFRALDPATNDQIEPSFAFGGAADVDAAVTAADAAFDRYSHTALVDRADFLDTIAANLEAIGPELVARTTRETGVPEAMLEWEVGKAAAQFRQFAQVVRQGRFLDPAIDTAEPDRRPRPRMDHRLSKVALGPVVVFGASNFPISYSVAGGDTAAALAAGCPVVVKAHNAHPGSSELQARAIADAVAASGLPGGVFSLVRGEGNEIGVQLVTHPLVAAVSFTGSEAGGMALYQVAQSRPVPIPFFAEMTSVNPTFVLPAALSARAGAIGAGFAERMIVNVGQACLKPGVVVAVDGPGYDEMRAALASAIADTEAHTMLTPGIAAAFDSAIKRRHEAGAEQIACGGPRTRPLEGVAALFEVGAGTVLEHPELLAEVFGPEALLVKARDATELLALARGLRGQLSAAIHLEDADVELARTLVPILERRTGRIVVNAFAHPQEVGYATVHGGPFPATTDSRFTSVGMSAIDRFLRPVTYQGFPDELLPDALKAGNPLRLARSIDGVPTQ